MLVGRRLVAVLLWLVAAVLAAGLAAPAQAVVPTRCQPPDCHVGVGGSPHGAAFVGTGGLLLDASFSAVGIGRGAVASCTDCEWLLVSICKGGAGTSGCHGVGSCPPATRRMLVFLRHAGELDFTQVGSYCMGPGGPVTVGEMAQRVSDVVVELMDPHLHGSTLTYKVEILDGEMPAVGGPNSLFIDVIGRPLSPVSVAGVNRRDRRRDRR